jgi:hypothetical protein
MERCELAKCVGSTAALRVGNTTTLDSSPTTTAPREPLHELPLQGTLFEIERCLGGQGTACTDAGFIRARHLLNSHLDLKHAMPLPARARLITLLWDMFGAATCDAHRQLTIAILLKRLLKLKGLQLPFTL